MKISDLKEPYKSLAELRRKECALHTDYGLGNYLNCAFGWTDTKEGWQFWFDIESGNYPPIPKSKFITVRENMINEIKNSDWLKAGELSYKLGIGENRLYLYMEGDESALNGEEIQKIFDYLKK